MTQGLIELLKTPQSRLALAKELRNCNAPEWTIERVMEPDMEYVGIVQKQDAELFVMAAAVVGANPKDYCVMVVTSGNFAIIIGKNDDADFRNLINELNGI